MFKSIARKLFCTAAAFTLAFASGAGMADDTEIYFSSGNTSGNNAGSGVLPNVLFILDTSQSMDQTVSGTGKSRIQLLREALDTILADVTDVNIGIMRFNYNVAGSVIFPMHYIDDPVTDVVGESDIHYGLRITSGNDDGQENLVDNTVSLTDSTLNLNEIAAVPAATYEISGSTANSVSSPPPASVGGGRIVSAGSRDAKEVISSGSVTTNDTSLDVKSANIIAMQFTSLSIPKGATIDDAFIDMTVKTQQAGTPANATFSITVETTDNAPNISTFGSQDISSRSFYGTPVTWSWSGAALNPAAGTLVTSPDIKTLVQTIVNRSGWNTGQAMLFKITSNSTTPRQLYSYDGTGTSTQRPTLRVRYTIPGVPYQNYEVALRFPTVNIPQGATVTGAQLVFSPQASNSGATDWTIWAEASDNSPALSATASNISSRTKTAASAAWTSIPNWSTSSTSTTPASIGLVDVVQEIVNRSGWCGGHAITFLITGTGLRRAKSQEQAASTAPMLQYTYNLNGTNGCTSKTKSWQINAGSDDVEETEGGGSDGAMNIGNNGALDIDSTHRLGLRFTTVDIPKNATIHTAVLEFTAYAGDSSTATNKVIQGQAIDNAPTFTSTTNEITNRTKTTASVNWTPGSWSTNGTYQTSDITSIVQELVNRSGWASGNAMAFFIYGATGTRRAVNYETSGQNAVRLRINFDGPADTITKTVRERAIEIVDDLVASDYTPSVPTLYEAAHYWRGESVVYGLTRNSRSTSRISHAGSYCNAANDCNGADTNGYPPFGVEEPSGCDSSVDPSNSACAGEVIHGSPTYISPFNSTLSCQRNYQVFLTDGAANVIGTAATDIRDEYLGGAACLTANRATPSSNYTSSQSCGVDLAKYMFENDQDAALANAQNVLTYTIAFNLTSTSDTQWLQDMAYYGTGQSTGGFYSATDATDLVSAFNKILTDVKKDPTSFVAPSLATNAFNRLLSRDEVYFGLFTPDLATRWFGNVKKYRICIDSAGADPSTPNDDCTLGEILDANDDSAIDPTDNKFSETAKSLWSDVVDGQATTKGGAGGELTDYTQRIIYTDATSSGSAPASGTRLDFATNPGYQIDVNTWDDTGTNGLDHIRSVVCPTPSTTAGSDCADRMLWMLGKVIDTDATNDPSATTRWSVNDVLHSSPVIITYGGSDSNSDGSIDTFFDKLVVGTNEGGLRFVNGSTGKEEWTFMPKTAFSNQQQLYDNPETDHLYGLDLTPTLQVYDANSDGQITTSQGDFVRVFAGMRLGGDFLYALDVSATLTSTTGTVVPKFLWRIQGSQTGTATTGFERMGRTWSQPRLATIFIDNSGTPVKTEVLIFGGGYDTALDDCFGTDTASTPTACSSGGGDNKGNALYIVNPATGARILSISGTGSGADIVVPNMHYSIPTRITVTDSNGDGVDDRLYFGDTGGQVWRVDLGTDVKDTGASRAGHTVVGRLANLAVAGTAADQRRFFEPPSIVQVKDSTYSDASNGEYDYVLIGSGWRQHPLNKDVDDRFYALRDKNIGTMVDADSNHLADSYPNGTSPATTPITDADLIDITTQVLDASNTDHTQSLGWYYDFTESGNDGEKVLSSPITLAGTVFFTTYLPDAQTSTDQCTANIGGGNAYNFNILSAAATIDWDLDGSVDPLADRAKSLGGGIPSDVVPVFTKEGIVGIVGIEGGAAQLGTLSGLPRFRTYWYEESGT